MDMVVGLHAVRTVLTHNAKIVRAMWHDKERHDKRSMELLELATQHRIPVHEKERTELDLIAHGVRHQGIAIQINTPTAWTEATLYSLLDDLEQRTEQPFLLVLDEIQDPHNLGACLRTAEAAGVHAIIAPKDRSVGLVPSVCKVASGAAGQVPYVQVTNLARTLKTLKSRGLWLTGTAVEAPTTLYQSDLRGPLVVLLGGESKGLRRLTREHCDHLISLPMLGIVESLNVSVATGIVLYEALRQRLL
jgi:23S rRNA (guanosine2251-2'-O)-methyltransferase